MKILKAVNLLKCGLSERIYYMHYDEYLTCGDKNYVNHWYLGILHQENISRKLLESYVTTGWDTERRCK